MKVDVIPDKLPNSDSTAGILIKKALSTSLEDFSDKAVKKAELCLLDYLSCVFESRDKQWSVQARDLAVSSENGAPILGDRGKFDLQDAMFANAVMGHGLVREDMHVGSVTHLGVIIWPTILGVGYLYKSTGKQALEAAITGYEIGAKIGRLVINKENSRYFRPTGLIGPMVSAVVAAKLMGLSSGKALSAFALAANCSSGLNQWGNTGGSEMYFHPGFAVQNAMRCVRLADKGAWASPTILEGRSGFIKAYSGKDFAGPLDLFAGNGKEEILQVFNKPAPACNFAQTPCQVALAGIKQLGKSSSEIKSATVYVTEAAALYPGCASKGPFVNELQAKMSIIYGVAATLAFKDLGQKNYDDLENPETQRLINLINLEISDDFTKSYPAHQGASIKIILSDGSEHNFKLDDVVPADRDLVKERFANSANTLFAQERVSEIINFIDRLPDQKNIGDLAAFCSLDKNESSLLAKGVGV